jgi:hypothetical protein
MLGDFTGKAGAGGLVGRAGRPAGQPGVDDEVTVLIEGADETEERGHANAEDDSECHVPLRGLHANPSRPDETLRPLCNEPRVTYRTPTAGDGSPVLTRPAPCPFCREAQCGGSVVLRERTGRRLGARARSSRLRRL